MNSKAGEMIIGIVSMIIGVAVLAVILSKQANTSSVISAFGAAVSQMLTTAISPITSGGSQNGVSL